MKTLSHLTKTLVALVIMWLCPGHLSPINVRFFAFGSILFVILSGMIKGLVSKEYFIAVIKGRPCQLYYFFLWQSTRFEPTLICLATGQVGCGLAPLSPLQWSQWWIWSGVIAFPARGRTERICHIQISFWYCWGLKSMNWLIDSR